MANKAIDKHYLLETLKDFYAKILLTFFQKKLAVATVPSDPDNGDVIIYTGITSGDFIQGHIYKYSSLPGGWVDITPASSGGTWGSITGTLSDQTDLQEALDAKATAIELSTTEYNDLPIADKKDPSKIYFILDKYGLVPKTWNITFEGGANIWTYSTDIYCSKGTSHYKLVNNTWETVTWTGGTGSLSNFNAVHIWSDGSNTYYSDGSNHYKFNGTGWDNMSWSGYTSFKAQYIWTDGTNIYSSNNTDHYKLNGTTWEAVTWTGLTSFLGSYVWSDGTDIYYSEGSGIQYRLNGTNWEVMTWSGLTGFYGQNIWEDGENIYYSQGNLQYVLDGTTWKSITWEQNFYGSNVWKNGAHIYCSDDYEVFINAGNEAIYYKDVKYADVSELTEWGQITGILSDQIDLQTVLDEKAIPIKLSTAEYNSLSPSDKNDSSKIYFVADKDNSISTMTWSGLTYFYGSCVWTDGTNIYYSNNSTQYKLNGTTWETMSWTGPSLFVPNGIKIWTDGSNIYYSDQNFQCKLNGTTWEPMTWTGLTSFQGDQVWTDGTNIYYSYNGSSLSGQYKLNGTTWEPMTWTGLTDFNGDYIWTDGTNIYYSNNSTQYKLNGTTWETMTWSGHSSFSGHNVWSDGSDVYYSYQSVQYKLDGTTWEDITWDGITTFNGFNIWTDGNNYYYSNESNQYIVNTKAKDGTEVIYYKDVKYSDTSGVSEWGDITGTLSNQTDLQTVLDEKAVAIRISQPDYDNLPEANKNDISKVYFLKGDSYFEEITIPGHPAGYEWMGYSVWYDNSGNTYFSYSTEQYKFNGSGWESMTWTGLTSFNGRYVWSDGSNIYYSEGSNQYRLNGTNWESITWGGYTNIIGDRVWTDGTNVYFSNGEYQYRLNGTTWETVTWSGYSSILGEHIWTDGTDIYYSYDTVHYKLNGTTWETITWTNNTRFLGHVVWTDGTYIYAHTVDTLAQLKFDGNTTWEEINWDGDLQDPSGSYVWHYDNIYYYTFRTQDYKLHSSPVGIYYRDTLYASETTAVLSGVFSTGDNHVDINISSLNTSSVDYTFKYFSTVEGIVYKNTSYNSSTGVFTINFMYDAPSAGTFYIQAHKIN